MAQVIEVRFVNPETQEMLHDCFTSANTYQQAIELALREFSGGVGVLKRVEKQDEAEWLPRGTNSCWRQHYLVIVEDDEQQERVMLAIVFASYKEHAQHGH